MIRLSVAEMAMRTRRGAAAGDGKPKRKRAPKKYVPWTRETNDAVMAFVVRFCIGTGGVPPTLREICDGCDLSSTNVAHRHLKALEERGLVRSWAGAIAGDKAGASRGIEVVGASWVPPAWWGGGVDGAMEECLEALS